MKFIKRFNEEVGFDDEEMRDRLEIPNLKGELEPGSPTMKHYYVPTDKVNTSTEVKKLLFRYPILERFFTDSKIIEGSRLESFFATSKIPVNGLEFYTQISFAYHDGQYFISSVLRDRLDWDNEDEWVRHAFFFDEIKDVFVIVEAFLKCCVQLGVIDRDDLSEYDSLFN